jgi:hypothetical protein
MLLGTLDIIDFYTSVLSVSNIDGLTGGASGVNQKNGTFHKFSFDSIKLQRFTTLKF